MTIKQNGGVFGRNPTFNDVTIEGELTFDGDIDVNSDLKVDGNLEVTGTSTLDGAVLVNQTVSSSDALQATGDANLFAARLNGSTTVSQSYGLRIRAGTNEIDKSILVENTGGIDIFTVKGNGDVGVDIGNVIIGTSGKGIDFSATAGTGTSELFDDYEEGVWTPTYAPQTGSFTSITYNSQLGKYTKVGDTVYAFFDLNVVVDPTGASGTVSIGGLPFFGLQTACFGGIGAARRFATSFTFGGLQTSGTAILPYKTDTSNLNLVPLDVTDLATGGVRNLITAGVTYKVS
jgi:hypothetical protein